MTYGSACSGIEAASVAWRPLGWRAAWFSEVAKFPSAVLAYRYPKVPNLGDMTRIHENPTFRKAPVDLLVAGTPCQSFSSAGVREGLDDPRGNLALEFLRLVGIKHPRWVVWENVPGVLSSSKGRDFGAILGTLEELGYGWAYRTLDAQHFGVPQRRRRVFVVAHLDDWRPPAAVLFERESLRGDTPKGTNAGKARSLRAAPAKGAGRRGTAVDIYNYRVIGDVSAALTANSGGTNTHGPKVLDSWGVRVFHPIEAERMQGFPDNYTKIPGVRCLHSYRHAALGNSMAVPVMRWIGRRIAACERVLSGA